METGQRAYSIKVEELYSLAEDCPRTDHVTEMMNRYVAYVLQKNYFSLVELELEILPSALLYKFLALEECLMKFSRLHWLAAMLARDQGFSHRGQRVLLSCLEGDLLTS
jgi:hypothetical protein